MGVFYVGYGHALGGEGEGGLCLRCIYNSELSVFGR